NGEGEDGEAEKEGGEGEVPERKGGGGEENRGRFSLRLKQILSLAVSLTAS
ncbi:hypothetical protein SOVF_212950, partial [Spinacia oleracea]